MERKRGLGKGRSERMEMHREGEKLKERNKGKFRTAGKNLVKDWRHFRILGENVERK